MELYWDAKSLSDEETKCSGKIKVFEFSQDDDDELRVEVTCEKPGKFVQDAKTLMRKDMTDAMLKVVCGLQSAMKKADVDEEKIRRDQAQRKEAEQAYK